MAPNLGQVSEFLVQTGTILSVLTKHNKKLYAKPLHLL